MLNFKKIKEICGVLLIFCAVPLEAAALFIFVCEVPIMPLWVDDLLIIFCPLPFILVSLLSKRINIIKCV